MKMYAATRFIIIGIIIIVIIIIIVNYTLFKIIEVGNNEAFWVTHSTSG